MRAEQPPETSSKENIMRASQVILNKLYNNNAPQRARVYGVTSTVDRDALAKGELRVTVSAFVGGRAGSTDEPRIIVFTGEDAIQFVELSINQAGVSPQG
jgi:hypothetical protein